MKKNLIAIMAIALIAVACNSNAQTAIQPNAGVAVISPPPDQLFRANEFSVRLAVVNPLDLGQTTFDPQAKSLAGFEAGMGYYVTRYLGAEVNVPVWRSDERCFQSVSAGIMARLPLDTIWNFENHMVGKLFMDHIAPYVRVGMGYAECWTSPYSIYAGGGIEVRFNQHIGVFGGATWHHRGAFSPDSWDVVQPEVGVRFAF